MSPVVVDKTPVDLDEEVAYQDYFGFNEEKIWYFPDGKQYITFKIMTEGDRAQYQKQTSRDVTLERQSGNAKIKVDPGEERQILVERSVTGWKVMRKTSDGFKEVPFGRNATSGSEFGKWYAGANPKLIDSLVETIREANPWLVTDSMTVESVDEEIEKLQELREKLVRSEAGKGGSS